MKYDKDYFIKKFLKIPRKKWIAGALSRRTKIKGGTEYEEKFCALGHCTITLEAGVSERDRLNIVFNRLGDSVISTNDGYRGRGFKSPKQSILCMLLGKIKMGSNIKEDVR